MLRTGQIIKNLSNQWEVSSLEESFLCVAKGRLKNEDITPLVGDFCEFENNVITKILPRKNELKRPSIANVDIALIVVSVKAPDLSLSLLDKQITIITSKKVTPVICWTKLDLLTKKELPEIKKIIKYYQKIGILSLSNKYPFLFKLFLRKKVVVLTGQSGAGKSTFINKLAKNIKQKTSPISLALGRGKHTTRCTELFRVASFQIADTPGFSALNLDLLKKDEIKNTFIEFKKYKCEYKNCNHSEEKNCGVKNAVKSCDIIVSRYNNYLSFIGGK